ncbi:3-dehydroquinate synthase [bacterium]|nr:3-dehydroquinate synthase [bacterium]
MGLESVHESLWFIEERGAFGDRMRALSGLNPPPTSVFVLTDHNTNTHCLPLFKAHWPEAIPLHVLNIPPGEASKDWTRVPELMQQLSALGADRSSLLIALGGGVVTDFGGFVASVYQRGIRFGLIPTSLLAMVDASLGGKTGVDVEGVKNLAGRFAQPEFVGVWPGFLRTLPESEIRQGLAEMLKQGLMLSEAHWGELVAAESRWVEALQSATSEAQGWIRTSARLKLDCVASDPDERGSRAMLNFGHTVGHALESVFLEKRRPIAHGEAVLFGMRVELHLAKAFEDLEEREMVLGVLRRLGNLEESVPLKAERLLHFARFDKKNRGGALRLALPERIGKGRWGVECTESDFTSAIQLEWGCGGH